MMKQFAAFIRKEFYHVLRDRKSLLILFGMPVVQILIFGFALTNEVKNASVYVVDNARDEVSMELIGRMSASKYFDIEEVVQDEHGIEAAFNTGKIRLAIIFPAGLEHNLHSENKGLIQVIADASDPNTGNTLLNYASAIIRDYQQELNATQKVPYTIHLQTRFQYNPELRGAHNFVPGVMALVLMLVSVMMTAISIVREKEIGTMEVLLVSPFQPVLVIISKAIPYMLLSMVNVTSILLLSVFVLDLPVNGSLALLFAESMLYIITSLALGIFISIKTSSQQVAMLISLMGMLLPTMIFSGFMFPIENMPLPLQVISNIIPAKWFYLVVKAIMIKGLGFSHVWKETLVLIGMTLFLFFISMRSFKIRLA